MGGRESTPHPINTVRVTNKILCLVSLCFLFFFVKLLEIRFIVLIGFVDQS